MHIDYRKTRTKRLNLIVIQSIKDVKNLNIFLGGFVTCYAL